MIRVSDISTYLKCPRMSYFSNRGHNLVRDITHGYLERIILKELALKYESTFDKEDMLAFLNDELDRISSEISFIYRAELAGIDEASIAESISNVRPCLGNICSNLSLNRDFYASEIIECEPVLQSGKFGLSGSPDRLIKVNEKPTPSIIKTGNMPQNGVWHGDRLQLTAYSMLVEEMYDSVVERGFVEYARWGQVREVVIKRHDRRKILQIRDKIKNPGWFHAPEARRCTV